jgi:hypothetical protein
VPTEEASVQPELATDEQQLAAGALRVLALMAVPAGATAWLFAGPSGALGALIGLGLVLVLFGASASLLAWVAARRDDAGIGLLVAGAAGRLVLYVLTLSLLSQVSWVHRPSLAIATVAAIAVTMVYELRLLANNPRLFWLDPAVRPTTSVAGVPSTVAASQPSTTPRSRSL